MNIHVLKGCAPVPLANYLKALGVLRLVGEQVDRHARGWWEGENFYLLTKVSKEDLESFFLERYEPTPLLSPWNKGSGFFKKIDPGLSPIETSTASRFHQFREGIKEARRLLNEISHADAAIRAVKARTKTNATFQSEEQRQLLAADDTYKRELSNPLNDAGDIELLEHLTEKVSALPTKAEVEALKGSTVYKRLLAAMERRFKALKGMLIPDCRRSWRGPHAEWLSAAVVMDEEGVPTWPSLLGTGGNDGNLDFTNNFMQQLGKLFILASETGAPRDRASELLDHALWDAHTNKLLGAPIGQYQPGAAGGANSSTGFAGGNLVNPWDFILMMEGSLLFASRTTKRLDPAAFGRASAPFAVQSHATGFTTPGLEKASRGEQWMPLWKHPATLGDLRAMYGEARVQLARQTASRPIDMARAISRLGVARGIHSFVRYGYLERNGQSTLAVPLGRVLVRKHARAHLMDDLSSWLDRIQRQSRDRSAPARLVNAERYLSDACFAALTHEDQPSRWQAVLRAAARFESLQAGGTAIEAQPMPPLRPEWAQAANDWSTEFRLALALGSSAAFYTRDRRPVDSIRRHWLPLERDGRRFKLIDRQLYNDPRVVAAGRDPYRDLAAIVERRLIESEMKGQRRLRLVAAPGCGANLDDLAVFLRGSIDVSKLIELARAFMALRWDRWLPEYKPQAASSGEIPDEVWLSLRLANLAWPLTVDNDIPADPRIVRLLIANNVSQAFEAAKARLRSAGIRIPLQSGITDTVATKRWAAALAIPIHRSVALRASVILDPSQRVSSNA